jgi:hypothetical protein
MPIYTYEHPKTGKTIDLVQSMGEDHKYIDNKGVEWKRVFYPVTFAFDTKIDPHDAKAFVKKTDKGGTLGDIMDLSKEMSEKRGGEKNDEIKVKYDRDKEKKLNDKRIENLREERQKQFKEFQKLDKSKVKINKKAKTAQKNK